MLEEEPLGERVFHLVRIAYYVGGVEAGDGPEVVNPGNVTILNLRLDRVPQVAAEEPFKGRRLEIANQRRRPELKAGLQVRAVDTAIPRQGRSGAGNLALRVIGLTSTYLRPQRPAIQVQGQLKVRIEVKAADVSRLVARLTAAQSGCGTIHAPAQRRPEKRLVNCVEIESRHVQDTDLRRVVGVAHLGDAFKILIAVEADARRTPSVIVGNERRRRDLRSDCQRKRFGERLAIDERAEILAGGHGPGALVQVKVLPLKTMSWPPWLR